MKMAAANCLPWFHGTYAELDRVKRPVRSGCVVGSNGNVNCSPESMRANADQQLRAAGYEGGLSLPEYTLARYMTSEVGSGSMEDRVAVGEAAMNKARAWGMGSVLDLLLYRQSSGHANRGWYGPIHGVGTGTSTAPYGRWASTSKDPNLVDLLLAKHILRGETYNFADGAWDQLGMEYISSPSAAINNRAVKGEYWVGPLPGVNHWHTFLFKKVDPVTRTLYHKQLVDRALVAVSNRSAPNWSGLPICSKPLFGNLMPGVIAIGSAIGFFLVRRRMTKQQAVV